MTSSERLPMIDATGHIARVLDDVAQAVARDTEPAEWISSGDGGRLYVAPIGPVYVTPTPVRSRRAPTNPGLRVLAHQTDSGGRWVVLEGLRTAGGANGRLSIGAAKLLVTALTLAIAAADSCDA